MTQPRYQFGDGHEHDVIDWDAEMERYAAIHEGETELLPVFDTAEEATLHPDPVTPVQPNGRSPWLDRAAWILCALILGFVAFCFSGCSTTHEQCVPMVKQARILLKNPKPDGPKWTSRRDTWMSSSERWLSDVGAVESGN